MSWEPAFSLVLLGVIVISYYIARQLEIRKNRKRIVVIGVIITLLPLLAFKYYNFVNNSICDFLSSIGLETQFPKLNWIIPIGISFFTFQALGYLIDVYFKRVPVEKDFLVYALFLSFFPSIVAGPINKASLVIPQIKSLRPHFDYSKAVEGMKMLLWGMFLKVVVADRVALYVDTVFPHYMNYSGVTCFVASILYTIQIYADFSGYSLMAIGVGKSLGFELTQNFRRPYLAVSVTDFWRRWHISLSTWLKDYIYIPMGGSRCSKLRNYWNIFVTFLVSGIWHGANWTFLIWGIWHGLFQIIEKMLGQQKCNYGWFGMSLKIIVTFLLVNFAWIFFRMPSLEDAIGVICNIFDFTQPMNLYVDLIPNLPFTIFGIFLMVIKDLIEEFCPSRDFFNSRSFIIRWSFYLFILISIMLTGVLGSDQFIYANF